VGDESRGRDDLARRDLRSARRLPCRGDPDHGLRGCDRGVVSVRGDAAQSAHRCIPCHPLAPPEAARDRGKRVGTFRVPEAPPRHPSSGQHCPGGLWRLPRTRQGALYQLRAALRSDLIPAARCDCRCGDPGQTEDRLMLVPLEHVIALSAVIFGIGVVGAVTRRNVIVILMSIELMLNAVNLAFVGFSRAWANPTGQVFVLMVITVAAAEVAVGLGIVLSLFRNRDSVDVEEVSLLKW